MKHIPILIIALALLGGCGGGSGQSARYTAFDNIIDHSKPVALGEDDDVYVFCGIENRSHLEPLLKESIEREVALVYQEKYFNLIFADIKDMSGISRYKNLLIVGSLEGGDPVSRHIKETLSKDLQDRVSQSGGDIFISKNRFTRDQLIIHWWALTTPGSKSWPPARPTGCSAPFWSATPSAWPIKPTLAKSSLPVSLPPIPSASRCRTPSSYFPTTATTAFSAFSTGPGCKPGKSQNSSFPSIMKTWTLTGWMSTWLTTQRSRIGKTHFEGDSLNVETLRSERFKFAGRDGYRLSGAWINRAEWRVGHFRSFAFWDFQNQKGLAGGHNGFLPGGGQAAHADGTLYDRLELQDQMKPRLPVIFLILLVLSACTTNKLQPSPQQAPSQLPTHVSMYFYSAGSMQFYEGAYDTALNLFQRASSIDPGSVRIRRQLLLSAMYHYLQQRADSLEVKKLMDQNRDLIARDQELLDTAYSFYSETDDSEGIHWTIETMLVDFPVPGPMC
jgi:hypothetical protein